MLGRINRRDVVAPICRKLHVRIVIFLVGHRLWNRIRNLLHFSVERFCVMDILHSFSFLGKLLLGLSLRSRRGCQGNDALREVFAGGKVIEVVIRLVLVDVDNIAGGDLDPFRDTTKGAHYFNMHVPVLMRPAYCVDCYRKDEVSSIILLRDQGCEVRITKPPTVIYQGHQIDINLMIPLLIFVDKVLIHGCCGLVVVKTRADVDGHQVGLYPA